MASILITGAAGFIGRRVALAAERDGFQVAALARRPSIGITLTGDLRGSLQSLPAADWVFHLAGAYAGAGLRELEEADLAAAQNLLRWGTAAGVRNWVFASAAEVYGAVDGIATEQTPTRPVIPYGRLKLSIERMFLELPTRLPGSRVVILRIGEVYGKQGKLLQELRGRLARGFCPWFGDGNVPVSLVHVDDVAQAFVTAAKRAKPGAWIWNVADDKPIVWRAFLQRLAHCDHTRGPISLPKILAYAYAAGSALTARIAGRQAMVTRHIVRLITTPKAISNARIKRDIGFNPLYPDYLCGLEEALYDLSHHS